MTTKQYCDFLRKQKKSVATSQTYQFEYMCKSIREAIDHNNVTDDQKRMATPREVVEFIL